MAIGAGSQLPIVGSGVTTFNKTIESKNWSPLWLQKVINFCCWFWHFITCGFLKSNRGEQISLNGTSATNSFSHNFSPKRSLEDSSVSNLLNTFPGSLTSARVDSFASIFERFNDLSCRPVWGMDFVYVLTNEVGLDKTQRSLSERPLVEGGCHIGFSGMHNFDIIALRRSKYALIFDTNNNNTVFLRNVLKILKLSLTRFEFVRNMEAQLRPMEEKRDLRFAGVPNSIILSGKELSREGCWLNTDEGYSHVRSVALLDNICPITQNIINSEVFKDVAALLKSSSIQIDTLYLSNICNYMEHHQQEFCNSARFLSSEATIVIHCVARLDFRTAKEVAFMQRSIIQSTCLAVDLKADNSFFFMRSQADDEVLLSDIQKSGQFLESYAAASETQSRIARERLDDERRRKCLFEAGIVGLFD